MSSKKRTSATASQAKVPVPVIEGTTPSAPPAEAAAHARATEQTVLVFESGKGNQQRAEELVRSLGYRANVPDDAEAALRVIAGDTPPDLVLAGLPGGEAVVRAAVARGRGRATATVIASSGDTADGAGLTEKLGADAFVLRPYKRDALAAVLRAVGGLRAERARRIQLEGELASERSRLLRHGEADPATGFYHFEFFKRVLVIELKRAKRYGYSLAACLVAIDEPPLEGVGRRAREELTGQVARALRGVIRDIDLPVDYADGRFLVFLPYTDLAGAERVGRRLEAAVRGSEGVQEGEQRVKPSVSVGIAALKEGRANSFSKLVHDASLALRAAQLKGGARVVVKA